MMKISFIHCVLDKAFPNYGLTCKSLYHEIIRKGTDRQCEFSGGECSTLAQRIERKQQQVGRWFPISVGMHQ